MKNKVNDEAVDNTKIVMTDEITGAEYVVERFLPVPKYDLSDLVGIEDPENDKTYYEGHISHIEITIEDHPKDGLLYTIQYELNYGDQVVDEDEIVYKVPDEVEFERTSTIPTCLK